MSGRSPRELSLGHESRAKRDDRLAEMELSHRRLQYLYDISKLLTRFQTVERTVPGVVDLLAQAVPLRSAIFILAAQPGAPRAIAWQAPSEGAARLQFARTHAQNAYRYLVRSGADLARDETEPLPLPTPSTTPPAKFENNFVLLPFVVDHGAIFGALQVEGVAKLNELELAFVNAVINQLAIAVDRQNLISAQQATAEARENEQRLLANVSAIVGSSLDYRDTLATLARSAVPQFADLCLIDDVSEGGDLHSREVVFADEKNQRELADQLRQHSTRAGSRTMQATVLRSRKPVLFSRITDLVATGIAELDEAEILADAGVESMMAVPLLSRDKVLGVLTFATAESGRRYSTHDLAVAEEIARRASIAIDNARLYEQARQASRAREDLLAIVSHDLQSPLSVILLNLASLLRRPSEDTRPSHKQLATMQRSANRMCRLIEDLLATASIEAGRLSLKPQQVDVTSLVSESLAALEPLAATKSLHLTSELPADLPALQADSSRFLQILANLVGNAIKFTPAGGAISIRASASADAITFSVVDTGPGIAEEELPHLFRRYWQVPRTTRLGTGLGLFIVKGIVEAHGGKVWAKSAGGNGTTFFFTLPLLSPAKEAIEGPPPHALDDGVEREQIPHELPTEMARPAAEGPLPSTGEGLVGELAREVKLRNLELHTAVESTRVARELAERAGEFRRDFMSVVSHELRGPLTALELLIERLLRAEDGPPTAQQQQIIGRMVAASARLTTIVESLLQHALIQSGRLTTRIEAFDAREVTASVVEELRPYAAEKSLDLRFVAAEELPRLENDAMLLRLILLNLVGNAIKFTERGQVEVAITFRAKMHHFAIKDSGAGIPAAARVRIFEPFSTRGDARQKHLPGMGLGLTLVREIASALGGTVELDSEIGIGTTFTVSLPSLAPAAAEPSPPQQKDHEEHDQ